MHVASCASHRAHEWKLLFQACLAGDGVCGLGATPWLELTAEFQRQACFFKVAYGKVRMTVDFRIVVWVLAPFGVYCFWVCGILSVKAG